jgi:hypothetical protein
MQVGWDNNIRLEILANYVLFIKDTSIYYLDPLNDTLIAINGCSAHGIPDNIYR